jgi:integrase
VLRALLNVARHKWKVATADVDWRAHKLSEPEPVERFLTAAEADALLAASAPHMRAIIACALYTGLRRGNVVGLDWSQVDLVARLITVHGKSRKPGGKKIVVPIAAPLLVLFGNLTPRDHGPVFAYQAPMRRNGVVPAPRTIADVKTAFRAACRRAGLTGLRFHDLRHTAASWMVQEGVPLDVVQRILGHTDIKLTQRYAHRSPDAQRQAVEAIGRHWRLDGTIPAQQSFKKRASD